MCLGLRRQDVAALKAYGGLYDYKPEWLEGDFDGELSILIVDKGCRGCGIGKQLLRRVCCLARNDGMQLLEIRTDESCNWKIYECVGGCKVYESAITGMVVDKQELFKEYYRLEDMLTYKENNPGKISSFD